MICLSYVKTFDCDISIIRPFNNYGPRQNAGSYAGIIPLTINRVLNGEPAVVFGDGHQTRDYIYVKDTATAAIMMGQRDDLKGEIFNIASGHEYSMNWLVGEITKNINPNSKILYDHPRPGDVRRHIANVIKAKDKLGFEHKIPMIEGLQKTINWYVKEQK
jgi:UDP-glucose 4-epimerase